MRKVQLAGLAVVTLLLATPTTSDAAITCHATISPGWSIQRLVNSLTPGQTGCLRGGRFFGEDVTIDRDITLTSYGGEDAGILGRVVITAPGASLEKLEVYGVGDGTAPSVSVRSPGVTLRDNDIQNADSPWPCVVAEPSGGQVPDDLRLERNRIHDCGTGASSTGGVVARSPREDRRCTARSRPAPTPSASGLA